VTRLFVALLLLTQQPTHPPMDSSRVARDAVARFYAWYVPTSANAAEVDMRALRDKRWHFSPAIAAALRADSVAAARSPGEIVGLDMDPFLNSQDPCSGYAPTSVRRSGKTFLVDVHGTGECARHAGPDVTVRVEFKGTVPVFANFIYPKPASDDLLHLLAQLAADRKKSH
jgi:hypothetical protein